MRVIPYGPRALLVEYETLDEVIGAAAALRATRRDDIVDLVPAARTILVTTTGRTVDEVERWLLTTPPVSTNVPSELVTIDVRYDGADLAAVAAQCDVSTDALIALHSGATYTCAFCGFLPGFSYLVGLDPRLQLPRRTTPRTRVPAGSVAIAAEFTAVYPSASPGGWHLLGTTDAAMWDDDRDPPALVPPGARVRFRAV
jgi:KipI family sensor histidine kinase inhibitor